MEHEAIYHKTTKWIWAALGAACLAGAIFAGAWWHLATAGICYVMYSAHKSESDEQ